jgi:hypothetical protein
MRSKSVPLIALVLCLAAAAIYFKGSSKPPVLNVRAENPAELSSKSVEKITIIYDGAPLASQDLVVPLGKTLELTPEIVLRPSEVPTGRFVSRLFIVFHPAGTSEDVWRNIDYDHSALCGLIGKKDRVTLRGAIKLAVSEPKFEVGKYELRAFLVITDFEGDRHANEFVARATLVVAPAVK